MKIKKEIFKNEENQKSLFFLLVLFILTSIFGYWLISEIRKEEFNIPNYLNLEVLLFPSQRAEGFLISGGVDYPIFINRVVIEPAASPSLSNVKNGEKQIYSVWIKDPSGIDKVIASIKTDKKEEIIDMYLIEGTKEEGNWMGFWTTKDLILEESYKTIFIATNINGEEGEMYLPWYIEK